jgi:1-deoxy-D-xylulose-5-phosphate reductoisomerase
MKKVMIFGSTGSIGGNALSVIRKNRSNFKVLGLSTNQSVDAICSQVREFSPSYVCIVDSQKACAVKTRIAKNIKIFTGENGLYEFASIPSDVSLMAISGVHALKPLMINIEHSKRIALANKEAIVTAGSLVFKKAKRFNTAIIPVDSEINAIFQLLKPGMEFSKVYLTASGGPLLDYSANELSRVSVKKVLSHPTWEMGRRITIDSSTLLNKGFEVIESHHFFDLDYKSIDIVIHRESNVHAMIEFNDKSLFACMYPPDMKIPISFALNYPERIPVLNKDNFKTKFTLSFEPLELKKFPLLKIVLEAAKRKDNSLVILNACDEVMVEYFLKNKIKFLDMHKIMGYVFTHYKACRIKTESDVFFWDAWAREKTKEYLGKL